MEFNIDELIDINTVVIDKSMSREDRIRDYIRQIKNPYCYRDGKVTVRISFCETKQSLQDCIVNYLEGV